MRTGREDLTSQCQLDREAGNVAVRRPIVITADKNASDVKSAQKDDTDGMSYLDDEVSALTAGGCPVRTTTSTCSMMALLAEQHYFCIIIWLCLVMLGGGYRH